MAATGLADVLRAQEQSVANGIPVLSPYEELVTESQALMSVAARYHDVGLLAGTFAQPGVDVIFDNFVVLQP